MSIETVLKLMIGLLVCVILLAVFAVWQGTKQRVNARHACDALNGVTVHLRNSQSLCFVDGKLVKASP